MSRKELIFESFIRFGVFRGSFQKSLFYFDKSTNQIEVKKTKFSAGIKFISRASTISSKTISLLNKAVSLSQPPEISVE